MIQKGSIIIPADNSGVLKANTFHVYKGSKGKIAYTGDFIRVSAREVKPENHIPKKSKHKAILIKSIYKNFGKDGSYVSFHKNKIILLKKRLTPKSTILKGCV